MRFKRWEGRSRDLLIALLAGIVLEIVALAYWQARAARDCCCDTFIGWIGQRWLESRTLDLLSFLLLPVEHIIKVVEAILALVRFPAEVLVEGLPGLGPLAPLDPMRISAELLLAVLLAWWGRVLWSWGKRGRAAKHKRPVSIPPKRSLWARSARVVLRAVFAIFAGVGVWFLVIPMAGILAGSLTVMLRAGAGLPLHVSTTVEVHDVRFQTSPSSSWDGFMPVPKQDSVQLLLEAGRQESGDVIESQGALVRKHAPDRPRLASWRVCCKAVPSSSSCSAGEALAAQALSIIDGFLGPVRDETGTGWLRFSADGERAAYNLTIGHWHGPLAGKWTSYIVEFQRSGKGWIVVQCRRGMTWYS